MTDDRFDEPDFDDPAHAEVRDLLASARVEAPLPDDVAARLDATLAELTGRTAGEVPANEPHPTVVPLRRRSRIAPRLLAAAAVVVVAGAGAVGLGQVVQNTGGSDDKAGTAADSAVARDSAGGAVVPEAAQPEAPADSSKSLDSLKGSLAYAAAAAGRVPVLTLSEFSSNVGNLNLQRTSKLYALTGDTDESRRRPTSTSSEPGAQDTEATTDNAKTGRAQLLAATAASTCTPPKLDGVSSYALVLDGQPAVLVLHPASAGTRLVEAWSCDGTKVLAFTTVPG